MSAESDELSEAPFPFMRWGDYDCWEGQAILSFGESGLVVTPYNPEVSRIPSEAQKAAYLFQIEHGDLVLSSVLAAVLPYYQKLRPRYVDFLGAKAQRLMPPVQTAEALRALIDLRQVHVHPWTKDGVGYVGLQFGCTWDQEHGLGVMLHRDRVVDIGSADVSFAWAPKEADRPS